MSEQAKSRKPLIVGIIAAVVILGALLALVLTQCTGNQGTDDTTPVQTIVTEDEVPTYDIYWNLDRALYDGKSEAGMSSRQPAADGFFYVRFFKDGETIELKVADRKTINALEVNDIMDLEFDQDGVVVGVIPLKQLPVETKGSDFYVQSYGTGVLKINSATSFNGMEMMLNTKKALGIWDMTGKEGEPGTEIRPIPGDRVKIVANKAGEVTHVFVYDRPEYMQTFEAECQHCGKTVEWKLYNKTNVLPTTTGGHYQLQNDIQLKTQMSLGEDVKLCLDLNGYTVNGAENKRIFSTHNVGAELAIMDTSEGQKGRVVGHNKTLTNAQGVIVFVRYGAFYLYGGTLDGRDIVTDLYGACVSVPKNSYFYMYGGTILGGTAKVFQNAETKKYSGGLGGAVSVHGKFVMNDGTIKNGTAEGKTTAWNANGTPKSFQRGLGGNIYVASSGEFIMNGGTISGGKAGVKGGNIFLDGAAVMEMNGGTVTGGKVTMYGRMGGNINVSSKATLNLNGGSILKGDAFNTGGNVYVNGTFNMAGGYISGGISRRNEPGKVDKTDNSSNVFVVNGKFYMYGGSITGSVTVTDTAKDKTKTLLSLGGVARIVGPKNQKCDDLTISVGGDNVIVLVANMMDAAKVGVNTSMGLFSYQTSESNLDNFFSNVEGADVCYIDGRLGLGRMGCICGKNEPGQHFGDCDGTQLFWGPAGKTLSPVNGNVYLTQDITVGQITAKDGVNMVIDLNGYTLSAKEGQRALSVQSADSSITVTDSSVAQTGKVRAFGYNENRRGNAMLLMAGGTFNLYAGVLDGSEFTATTGWNPGTDKLYGTADDKEYGANGGAVSVDNGCTFNMFGGTIIGNKMVSAVITKEITEGEGESAVTKEITRSVSCPNGAALCIGYNSVFNMYAGTIIGGQVEAVYNTDTKTYSGGQGGAIYVISDKAKLNLMGGSIQGGSAVDGGAIYMKSSATINMDEGFAITGGVALRSGGNIRLDAGTFNMTGGLLADGHAGDHGGNFWTCATANVTGGQILRGTATKGGGNFTVNGNNAIVLLQGVEIADGVVESSSAVGANVKVFHSGIKELTIAEGTVISGGKAALGGNLYVDTVNDQLTNTSIVNITGGTITGGEAAESGGNVYIKGRVAMTMSGGTLTGGQAKSKYGGNLFVSTGCAAEVSGSALIEKGVCADSGGNIYTNGTLTISGGKVTGGLKGANAAHSNGNIYVVDGALELRGGQVDGLLQVVSWSGNKSSVKVSGAPVVKNEGNTGLYLAFGNKATQLPVIQVDGEMAEPAEIWVTVRGASVFTAQIAEDKVNTYKEFFHSDNSSLSIAVMDNCLALGNLSCLCGSNSDDPADHTLGCREVILTKGGEKNNGQKHMWTDWAEDTWPTESGFYRLNQADKLVELNKSNKDQYNPANNASIVIDLNGHTVTDDFKRILGMFGTTGATITITDTSAAPGSIVYNMEPSETNSKDRAGMFHIGTDCTLNLLAGTLNASKAELIGVAESEKSYASGFGGGIMHIDKATAAFNMYGGTLLAAKSAPHGGAITMTAGTVNIYAGSIVAGNATYGGAIYATGGTVNISGGTFTAREGAQAVNGGILALNGGNATISGNATFTGGKATSYGGNLFAKVGTLTISDSVEVKNGVAKNGGNIYINSKLVISGGRIEGGKNLNNNNAVDSNIYVVGGALELRGGYVDGCVTVINWTSNGSSVKVSGEPVVTGTANGLNLTWSNKATASATVQIDGTLGDGASIAITAKDTGAFTGEFPAADLEKMLRVFVSDDATKFIDSVAGDTDGTLKLTLNALPTGSCLCGTEHNEKLGYDDNGTLIGCNGTAVTWKVWTSETSLPTESGYWMLTKPVTVSATATVAADQDVVLNLNGLTITNNTANRTYEVKGSLTITDTVGGGVLQGGKEVAGNGGAVLVNKDAKLVLLAGEITGGTNSDSAKNMGANIYSEGNVYMLGGKVSNGISYWGGGNIRVTANGKFVMTDGIVEGGQTTGDSGGNLVLQGNAYLLGGIIRNGTANSTKNGGNIFVNAGGKTITMENVSILGGSPYSIGFWAGTLNVNAGTVITADPAITSGKSAIYFACYAATTVNLNGGTITGGIQAKKSKDLTVNVNSASVVAENSFELQGFAEGYTFGTVNADLPLSVKGIFKTADAALAVALTEDGLKIVKADAHVHCVCNGTQVGKNGHVCRDIIYTGITELAGQTVSADASYYLASDVTITDSAVTVTGAKLDICLNGHNLTGVSGYNALATGLNGHLTVTTCKADVLGGDNNPTNNTVFVLGDVGGTAAINTTADKASTIEIFGGNFTAPEFTIEKGNHSVVQVLKGSTLRLYNGLIYGGKNKNSGGNLRILSGATVYMYGGTIRDGQSKDMSGNVQLQGTLNMYGGLISRGYAPKTPAGTYNNIGVNGGVLSMSAGQITGGINWVANAAQVTLSGTATITSEDGPGLACQTGSVVKVKDISASARITLNLIDNQIVAVEGELPENWETIFTANGTAVYDAENSQIVFTKN